MQLPENAQIVPMNHLRREIRPQQVKKVLAPFAGDSLQGGRVVAGQASGDFPTAGIYQRNQLTRLETPVDTRHANGQQ